MEEKKCKTSNSILKDYSRLPNKLQDNLINGEFSPTEIKIILYIHKLTFWYIKDNNYQVTPHVIAYESMAKRTNKSRSGIITECDKLLKRKCLVRYKSKHNKYEWSLNLKWEEWILNSKNNNSETEKETVSVSDHDPIPETPLELKRHILEYAPGRLFNFTYHDYILDGMRKDNNTVELLNKSNELILYSIDNINLSDLQK